MNSTFTAPSPVSTAANLIVQPDAAEYCQKHNLLGLVELAARIASRHFTLAGPIETELMTDPDSDEELVFMLVPVAMTIEATSKQHAEYLREWIEQVSPELSLRITLSPHIVGNGE